MQRASSVGATFLMYIMQNSVCPPCGGGTLKCSCRKELGDQLQLVRSMLSEIAERSDTCHTMTDVTTIGDLRCECACGVQLVPETSAALFIKRTAPRIRYMFIAYKISGGGDAETRETRGGLDRYVC